MFVRKIFSYLVLLPPIVLSCMKYKFHKFDDVFYNGAVMVTYRRELRAYDCKRACLMTKGCRGFNMEWIQDIAEVGYCGLVDMRLARALTSVSNYSVYGLCPSGMIFYPTTSRCHKVVRKRKNWSESQRYCRLLNDQAHLMEIHDSKQQELFENMTEECLFSIIGVEYRGYRNQTTSGRQCQKWTSQYPFRHDMLNSSIAWILEENYCRNVGNADAPWCYTMDLDKRWEYCDIPYCSDVIEIKSINPSFGLWLGARRSLEGVDVVWSSSLDSVVALNYNNFELGEPTEQTSGNDCLISFRGQWSMAPCSEIKAFVCEY
ncbi:hypothetical protein LSH36_487g05054 [Paralvinella palmiformis]|uniref:Uncharacterized protein n=1 Tax=Paralvinella palmiformis TaxID=53620 RepID=A0AAD9JAI7_9ANNE|nr:hypothetical protein LSH36_487g05054 [Paralvinella palmiformis]